MIHILFIGYSNLLRRRILPILKHTPFTQISVAKHESQSWEIDEVAYTKFNSFEEAFNGCTPDIIYISTINSTHYELALRALKKGVHVIVDKPSTLDLADTAHLVNTAKKQNVLICESTVYLSHPQFKSIEKLLAANSMTPKHVTVHFSFPPLPAGNFRYKSISGGGAIYDTGPYTASIGRYFFNEVPTDVSINIHENNGEVETSYTALLKYRNGRSVMAFCSFNTEYINRINVLGENFLIDLDRVFTTPDDVENAILFRRNNKSETIFAEKGNSFQLFFMEVADALQQKKYDDFYRKMLIDSETIQQLINKIKNSNGN